MPHHTSDDMDDNLDDMDRHLKRLLKNHPNPLSDIKGLPKIT